MAHQVPPEVLDYLGSQQTLTLATSGSDGPWAATLTYVNDGPVVYFWTRPGSNTLALERRVPFPLLSK